MLEHCLQATFWVSVALIGYTYFVYPALMMSFARLRIDMHSQAEDTPAKNLPSIAVLVAAYNEELHIAARIRNLLAQDYPSERLQIVVGSDGSQDCTAELAGAFACDRVTVLAFQENRGKASVLNDLVAQTNADVLIFTDANTTFQTDTVRRLVEALGEEFTAACGELVLIRDSTGSNSDHHYWSVERRLKAAESAMGGLLGANGGVYVLRRTAYRPLPPDTICDDFVIVMSAAAGGGRVRYAPKAIAFEEIPADLAEEFQRRVRIGTGNYQALFRYPEFITATPYMMRFTYFSHKILRWFTPHLLLLVLFSSLFLWALAFYRVIAIAAMLSLLACLVVFVTRKKLRWPESALLLSLFALINLAFVASFVRFLFVTSRGTWNRTERS